jgi:hypothetical protein
MTTDLEKESVMRTKRASRCRKVVFHRSTWAVSPVVLQKCWWYAKLCFILRRAEEFLS